MTIYQFIKEIQMYKNFCMGTYLVSTANCMFLILLKSFPDFSVHISNVEIFFALHNEKITSLENDVYKQLST